VINRVLILSHPMSEDASQLANKAIQLLHSYGLEVQHILNIREIEPDSYDPPQLVIAIGGDGTVLRAQRLGLKHRIPVLGVAAGRLGFLAEVPPQMLEEALKKVVNGEYRIEHRHTIQISHMRDNSCIGRYIALNDAVLARGTKPRSLAITVFVDGVLLAKYVADGIIAATATGSTAYSLAAGGPILSPELSELLLTPIAAHLSFVRSIILPSTSDIDLTLARPQEALLSVDGLVDTPVEYGDHLLVTGSPETAQFIRLTPPRHFYSQLVAKLQYNLQQTQQEK